MKGQYRIGWAAAFASGAVAVLGIAATPAAAQCPVEWDLASAGNPQIPTDPPIRQNHAAAYDAASGEIVVFGGFLAGFGYYGDTWVWDGNGWTQAAASGPDARSVHAMAYDAARNRVVLFGGSNGAPLDDTWEWDGTSWTQATPLASPPGRFNHAMAYDSVRNVVVMTGGYSTFRHNDTWEYDGVTWTQRSGPGFTDITGRNGHAMGFDAARGTMVVFGGFGGTRLSDTWELGPTGWTQIPVSGPSGRQYTGGLAYNPYHQRLYLFGGQTGPLAADRVNDVWTYDGAAWTQVFAGTAPPDPVPPTEPNRRDQHTTTYDEQRHELVIFGGYQGASFGGVAGDTWATGCARCEADFDGDGNLTLNDFVQFRNAYTAGDLRADFDGDGALTLNDFVQFRNAYVFGCS